MTSELDPQLVELIRQIDAGERLQFIAQRVGLALWFLQDLESSSALCFAMLAKAKKGMGVAAGYAVLKEAESKPFGSIIDQLGKMNMLAPDLKRRFDALREERNWLVHRSKSDSRGAVHTHMGTRKLVVRLESIKSEAIVLLRELEKLAMAHALKTGLSQEEIMARAKQSLEEWRSGSGS